MVLFGGLNPVFQVITDSSQQNLLETLRENIKKNSTHHVRLDEEVYNGSKENFYDFSMTWETPSGQWSSGGFVPTQGNGKMTLRNPTNKTISTFLAEINMYGISGTQYLFGFEDDSFRIKVKDDNTLVWEYLSYSGTIDISSYVDRVFWVVVNTNGTYPIISVYDNRNGETKDDLKDYGIPELANLKTALNKSLSIDPSQNNHRIEHILLYGVRFTPTPEIIHEREGFPIDNVYIRPDGSVHYKVPISSGTDLNVHTNESTWNPHIVGNVPWVPLVGDINPSSGFAYNGQSIASELSSGAVLLSEYALTKGKQWVMLNGVSSLTENEKSALWGLTMGLVAKSDTRYEEGVYYDTEPLYGNKFSLPYYSYLGFDNNGNPYTYNTITERMIAYDSTKTAVNTITNVNDISHVMYTWYPDDHYSSGIHLEIHMNDGTVHSNYLGPGENEEYVIAIQNMWDRSGLSDPNIHLDLNTVFSETSISTANQTPTNNNIHLVDLQKQYATDEMNQIIQNNTIVSSIKEPFQTHVNDLQTYNPINDRIYLSEGLYQFSLDHIYKIEEHPNVQVIRGENTVPPDSDFYGGVVYLHVSGPFGSLDITEDGSLDVFPDRFVYDDTAPEPFVHPNFITIPSTEPIVLQPEQEYIIYLEGSGMNVTQDLIDAIGSGNKEYIKQPTGELVTAGSSSGSYLTISTGSGSGTLEILAVKNPLTGIVEIYEKEEVQDPIVTEPNPSIPLPAPFEWDNTLPYEYSSGSGLSVGSGGEIKIVNPDQETVQGWLIDATIDIHGQPTITEPFASFGSNFNLYVEPEWNLMWEYNNHTGKVDIKDIVLAGPYKVLVSVENEYPVISIFNEDVRISVDLQFSGVDAYKEIKENGDLSKEFSIGEHTDENYTIYYENIVIFKPPTVPTIDEILNTTYNPSTPEVITTASLTALGHSKFDYHNYQLDNNYLDIRLKYEFYYVDANGVPTDDTNATKVYYTGMYQLTPNSYDQHQHTIIDKNDTNIRTIKIPDASTLTALRVHIVDGEGTVYVNNTAVYLNIQNTSVSLTSLNHNDILKIEYVSNFVSDTVEFKILLQNFTEYIPRDLIQTNYNGNVITRSTQPIWYVRDNTIIINLEKLVGHTYMFNNLDSHLAYVPVFPHNYRPYNNGYFPEIAIPYKSGMKVKWLGLRNVITPNSTTPSQLSIIRAQYNEERTGWGGIVYSAGWGHSSTYMTADHEYDIVDGDPDTTDPTYVGTYLKMEQNLDALYKTAINVYFHKIP